MGVTRLTYCGPYVECKVQKTTSTYTKRQCPNTACKLHGQRNSGDKFCPECGSAIQEFAVEVEVDAVDPWELGEEGLAGRMSQFFFDYPPELEDQGVHVWIGDKGDEADERTARSFWVYDDDQSLDEVRPADIEAELQRFSTDYQDELNQLRAAYGTDEVTVKWGILHSIHC